MTFKDYKKDDRFSKPFVNEIAKLTLTTQGTVYKWLRGAVTPPAIKQDIIAKYLGKPVTELFPQK